MTFKKFLKDVFNSPEVQKAIRDGEREIGAAVKDVLHDILHPPKKDDGGPQA